MEIKLDPDQRKAVEHFEGPALVVAGPGSGKTTVIKERILHLIRKHKVDPDQILAIAFTNAAADEMTDKLSNEQRLPKICTLHVFGKDIIEDFTQEPTNIWNDKKIREIIEEERDLLDQKTRTAAVSIYKIEDKTTHQCYIGQTTNPDQRKKDHFSYSSNRGLREVIQQKGKEAFDFTVIEENVKGAIANPREEFWINSYRNRSVVNLVQGMEQIGKESSNTVVVIYKIKSLIDCTAYIGYTTDPESIRKIVEGEGTQLFAFEVICKEVPWIEVDAHIANEIKKHKDWAVFNRQNPQKARYSNQLRIEMFCQYFNIPYDEVLESPEKFENLMDKFNNLTEDIEREKRQVTTGKFAPDTIEDPVLRAFAKKYEERRKDAQAVDFLDMLIDSAHLLETKPVLHQYYRGKYRYVFVDEFQDISPIDFRLIDFFSENLFAVGDDDQAIYGFRGGDSSIMREKFGKRRNVVHYEITRNYRSTSTIVRHARALIEHNPKCKRIPKNLRAKNSDQNQVKIFETPQKTQTVKEVLLRELSNLSATDLKKVGILARNWKGEINKIQDILDFSELQSQGFEIDWEELGDPSEKNRRKIILRRGTKEIEILNIYTAKGREWEKVILLVNTMYDSLPDDRNDLAEERRLFYVAITRAKQELVVLNGGNCQFIPEFQNAPPTKEELEEAFRAELVGREPKLKIELEEASKAALIALESRLKKEIDKASKAAREQHEPYISHLERIEAESKDAKQNEQKQIKEKLPQKLKTLNNAFLEELIPVLDTFESQFNSLPASVESNNESDDFVEFTQSVRLAEEQLLDSLKNHGLKPIKTVGELFNPDRHEEILPAIYSDEVQAGWVVREERRGYLLHNQIIRKAQVVVSKGPEFLPPETLSWIVGRYLDRLISEFRNLYQFKNINKAFVKQKMVQYLTEQDNESVRKLHAFAVINRRPSGHRKRYADYCIAPEKIHLCTDVFRDFWNRMWQVVEQSRKIPESFDKPPQPSVDKPIPTLKIKIERPEEPPKLRNIERMSKTVETIPGTNQPLHVPEAQRIPLDKLMSVIVPEPVTEMVDTPPPMSTNFTESLDTSAEDLKPETHKIVGVRCDPLYEPIDLIVPEPVKEVVDSQLPKPKDFSEIPNPQIPNLIPEILEIETDPKPLKAVNINPPLTPHEYKAILTKQIQDLKPDILEPDIIPYPPIAIDNGTQETSQGHEDFLKKQIQDLKPETSEPENSDNVTQVPTLETSIDGEITVESTTLTLSDSSTEIDRDAHQIKEQNSSENKVEDAKKNLRYYLRCGGHFAVEKIKAIIFRKPSS